VKQSIFFIMNHLNAIMASRRKQLVTDDKFDRHMTRARLQDISNRKQIFDDQTEKCLARRESRKQLTSSVY
jgi:hypothetical protein